jgi:hypothetical protein
MPMGGALAGAGIIANIGAGIAGQNAGAGDAGAARNAALSATQQLLSIGYPPDLAQQIVYKQFQQAGTLTPELEQYIQNPNSMMADVQGSQQAQNVQLQALQALQQRGQTGLTPEDIAALNQTRQQVAADTNARQQGVQQQMAARGEGGSGAELIGELQAAQSGANTESQAGDRIAAMASQNALQAIGQAGSLGGQIQQQQFGEQAQKAQAQDIINKFNTQNQINVQNANVQAQNQAQQYNLNNAQQLQNANTQQANQELLRENQAQQQDWQNQNQYYNTRANAYTGQANYLQGASQRESQQAAAPWQAIGAGATTLGGYMMSPSNSNTNNENSTWQVQPGSFSTPAGDGSTQKGFADGGTVPAEPTFADKLAAYFSSKPVQPTVTPDQTGLSNVQNSFNGATHYAHGGNVDPQFEKLKRMFPHTPEEVLRDIHAKANPTPVGSPMVPPAPMPIMPKVSKLYANGGTISTDEHQRRMPVTDFRNGGGVPGQANVAGDSPKNDTVPAMLSPGEYVVPRSQAKSPFGKKLIKLLEAHHEVMKHSGDE